MIDSERSRATAISLLSSRFRVLNLQTPELPKLERYRIVDPRFAQSSRAVWLRLDFFEMGENNRAVGFLAIPSAILALDSLASSRHNRTVR